MKKYTTTPWMLLLVLVAGSNMLAATRTSSQSGNWNATSTWSGNPVPGAGDDVIINGGFTVTVDIPNASCLSIQIGGSTLGTGSGTLSFSSGAHVTVFGAITVGVTNNTPGSIVMAGGGTLTCEGFFVNRLGTWTPGTGTIELTASNTIPNDNNIIFDNLMLRGGTTGLTRNINVTGNLTIDPGAALVGGTNTITLGGDWTNNGAFTGGTGTVTFNKNGNQTITGSGTNNFNLIRVDMGTSISNTLEVSSTNFNAPNGFLTIVNGTFKMSGIFTFSNTFTTAAPVYNIDPTAGFWINNPNVSVTAQAGGLSVRGLLRLSAGTYNIGTSIDNSLNYVTGSSIIIEGGALNIAGQLTRNNATATTSYTQSGGTVTIVAQGSTSATFGGFDLGAAGSTFTMSGGTIVIRNATSAAADYVNAASVASVTGGTLQIGDASTSNVQNIRIQSSRPIGNLLISNATPQATKPTAQLITSGLNIVGNVTIQSGTALNANGLNFSVGGDWSNSGTFTAGPTVTFNGTGAQGMTTAGGETFNTLTINKAGGTLTLNNAVTVNGTLSLTQGTISIGNNLLTLNAAVTGVGTLVSSPNGTVNYNQSTAGQNVLAGSYGNILFSNFTKTLSSTGIIGISGAFTPGSASGHTTTGSTIDFNGASQVVPDFPYNILTLSGSGTKTGSGTLTVAGNLTNNTGVVFTGTSTLNMNGATHTNNGTIITATLAVGSGATLTNNGTITSNSTLTGVGSCAQGANGTLNIGGTFDVTTFSSSVGSAVNYTGAGQTVRSTGYHHLTLSGSGTPLLTGISTISGNFTLAGTVATVATTGMTIGGNFVIGSGTSFDAGSFSHVLKGNWSNSGTFNANTSTFTLNGSTAQTMSGSTFNNLVIDNAAGVSMLTDEAVSNTLTLTSGILTTGTHKISITNSTPGAVVINSGSVNGEVVRAIAAGTTSAYMFTDVNTQLIPSGSQGAIVVSVRSFPNTTPPNIGSGGAVNRYYVITPTGALTAKVRLSYLAGETNGIPEASMALFRTSGIVWALVPSIPNSQNKYVETTTNVSEFSNWTIGTVDSPLPIQLVSFTGTMINGADAQLSWVTLSEVSNYGFNVLRKRPDYQNYVELPGSFVPGHGTTNEPHTYTYTDAAPGFGSWQYRLKQIDLDGSLHYSDPIQIDIVTGVNEEVQPLTYALKQNYPNPFNPSTTIRFSIPRSTFVSLKVYNLLGQEVATLVNGEVDQGEHEVIWNSAGQASGMYFYQLKNNAFTETKRMILLK